MIFQFAQFRYILVWNYSSWLNPFPPSHRILVKTFITEQASLNKKLTCWHRDFFSFRWMDSLPILTMFTGFTSLICPIMSIFIKSNVDSMLWRQKLKELLFTSQKNSQLFSIHSQLMRRGKIVSHLFPSAHRSFWGTEEVFNLWFMEAYFIKDIFRCHF